MKRLIPLLLAVILLAACAPRASDSNQPANDPHQPISNSEQPANNDSPVGDPNQPTSSDDPVIIPQKLDNTIPRPADKELLRGNAYVESTDLLTMESYPLQFTLVVSGNLPTPCNQLRVDVQPPDAEHKIVVDVYSIVPPDKMCAEVLQPFSVNVPLGSFASGHYTVWVNGEQVAEFDA
jgi:inhibitor of cysteine peptidase